METNIPTSQQKEREYKQYIEKNCFKGNLFDRSLLDMSKLDLDNDLIVSLLGKVGAINQLNKDFDIDHIFQMDWYLLTLEALKSSKIEGTISSVGAIESKELKTGDDKEVSRYKDAFYKGDITINKNKKIIRRNILDLLSKELSVGIASGKIRTEQNAIGRVGGSKSISNIQFIPVCTNEVENNLDKFISYINNTDIKFEEKIVRAGIAHAMFEIIHPYNDGNGRIGRMLIGYILYTQEVLTLPMTFITNVFDRESDTYRKKLSEITKGGKVNYKNWVSYYLESLNQSLSEILEIKQEVNELKRDSAKEIKKITRSVYYEDLTVYLFAHPYFNRPDYNKYMEEKHNVRKSVSDSLLNKLKDSGIVRVVQEGKGRRAEKLSFPAIIEKIEFIWNS